MNSLGKYAVKFEFSNVQFLNNSDLKQEVQARFDSIREQEIPAKFYLVLKPKFNSQTTKM